ncbi:MAG: hypothetical protein JJU28_01365 [Cyclobacteriaceae bacterium]|nr:hypothetical protein [Cyclobacteriaceae bacterium]
MGIFFAQVLFSQTVRLDIIGALLSTNLTYEEIQIVYSTVRNSLGLIFLYHIMLVTLGLLMGFLVRRSIRYFKLDRKYRFFRFSNKWYYIFSGECLDFPDVPDSYQEIGDKALNILCDIGGKQFIYSGWYSDYYLDSQGNLESVQLKDPIRRSLDKDNKESNRYYKIPSKYFLIPVKSIININILYIKFEDKTEVEPSTNSV